MSQQNRIFRVFVSSTFSDLKAERNALQQRVFPRLRELAASHGCRFQAIDLRWGVSEEASLDQQAMNICLGEIARCQQTSPRPNFIVLLGDRYGWCPPPSQIPAGEFRRLLGVIDNPADQALLYEWYGLDENAVPLQWLLKPRRRGSQYENYNNWQPVEARLQAILEAAAKEITLTDEDRLPYTASATEQEIAAGALTVKDAPEHVLCFFRSMLDLPRHFGAPAFQAALAARLQQEYAGDSIPKTAQDYIKTLLQMPPASTARNFADRIKSFLEQTPKATVEEEVLKSIRQVLVDFTARDFLNLDEQDWTVDEGAHAKQIRLKERLKAYVPGNVHTYQAQWIGSAITSNHIDRLCEDVYNALAHIILDEIERPHEIIPTEEVVIHIQPHEMLDDEGRVHHKFAEERLRFFVGRTDMLAKIADYLKDSRRRTMAIVGAGGTGKSALLARAIQQAQAEHPNAQIVYRFIGATPGSSDGRSLLESLCHEISRRYAADQTNIPLDYRDLVPELGKRIQLATAERPLILFLDSLDQLSSSQGARSLIWLPNELPEHVAMVVSTRQDEPSGPASTHPMDTFVNLKAKQVRLEVLGGLTRVEGDNLLSQWLASAQRTLQPAQRRAVLDSFEQSQGTPLYLKLAFEEARLWISDSGKVPEQLQTGISGIIENNMIARLAEEGNHGQMLVSHALGYLAASRYGLAEDELVDLLSRDLQVYRWFLEGSYHLPVDLIQSAVQYRRIQANQPAKKGGEQSRHEEERAALDWLKEIRTPTETLTDFLSEVLPKVDGPRLPVVLWSRLSFDLAPYLTGRLVDGSSLLTFYHRELGEVASAVFLAEGKDQPYHARLADYFRFKADPQGDQNWSGSYLHGLSELPYHLTKAERFKDVYQTLTDFKFLEHKAAEVGVLERKDEKGGIVKTYTGVLQLQDDFDFALREMPGECGTPSGSWGDRPPLILTANEGEEGLRVYCPVCNKTSPIQKEALDTVITCPQTGCGAKLKLNLFVVRRG